MWKIGLIVFLALLLVPFLVTAQDIPLVTDPKALDVTGVLANAPMAASLRLLPTDTLTGVRLYASDLTDQTGDNQQRVPIPASAISFLPAPAFESLEAGSLTQVVVQVAAPSVAGSYAGDLTIRWEGDPAGELVIPFTVTAVTKANLTLVDPAQVLAKGEKGDQIERQVTLAETTGGAPLTDLQAVTQDLNSSEQQGVIPADQIEVSLPATVIPAGDMLNASVTVGLQDVRAGTYAGTVLFTAQPNQLVKLPLTLTVRDERWWPIVVLLVGTVLGLGLAAYKTRGRPRDLLVLRIVAVKKTLEDDQRLAEGFGPSIYPLLVTSEAAIANEKWEDAKTGIEQAELMVRRWQSDPAAWQDQLDYLQTTLLPKLQGEAVTQRRLKDKTLRVQSKAGENATPDQLRTAIFDIESALKPYEEYKQELAVLAEIRMNAPVEENVKELWRLRELGLSQRLDLLLPDDKQGWQKIKTDIDTLRQEMIQAIQQSTKGSEQVSRGADEIRSWLGGNVRKLVPAGALLPDVDGFSMQDVPAAWGRSHLFTLIVYAIGGLLLAGAGYSTLYLANPTFGSEPVGDYLALAAWGLGSQTTFAAVTDWFKGMDVPFL